MSAPFKEHIALLNANGVLHRSCPTMGMIEVFERHPEQRWVEIPFTLEAIREWCA